MVSKWKSVAGFSIPKKTICFARERASSGPFVPDGRTCLAVATADETQTMRISSLRSMISTIQC